MAKVLRPIGHEDRLSIVDHLDELRSRLFICLTVLLVAFGVCFWQNQALLRILNRALPHVSTVGQHGLAAVRDQSVKERQAFALIERGANQLANSSGLGPTDRTAAREIAAGAGQAAKALPATAPSQEKPITIGVGEPFTTTLTVAAYFALLFTLPVLLYELYAFVIPALTPDERRVAKPVIVMAPVLFLMGVAFAYGVILPPAVHFLQGYNSGNFDVLVQAKQYYTFEIFTMLGVGLAFQLPLALLALHRLEVVDGQTLTRHWRYAVVLIAVIAAALPGVDPVTMMFETLPLIVLYIASILMLKFVEHRAAKRQTADLVASESFDA